MYSINILPNGITSGKPNYEGNKNPAKRSDTKGWNMQVSRRLRKWFYSVEINELKGCGIAFTLTVRDCPKSHKDWYNLREALHRRLERDGLQYMQWLTEWQARGVPHFHGIAFFKDDYPTKDLIKHWVKVSGKKYGSREGGQNAQNITEIGGWMDYLMKHSTRSITNYQRSPENIPEGWKETGGMWGKYGDWPLREGMRFDVCPEGFYVFRRIVNQSRHSRIRSRLHEAIRERKNPSKSGVTKYRYNLTALKKEFAASRKFMSKPKKDESRFNGTSNWLDMDNSLKIMLYLTSLGFEIFQVEIDPEESLS